jgi:hypothetical protein
MKWNKKYLFGISLLIIIILCILYDLFQRNKRKENFTTDSEMDFLQIQNTINKHKVFDMNIIQQQASQEELDYFNEHGMWPWSSKVIELYKEAIRKNPYVRNSELSAVNYARTIYNENAIIRILTYQSKEGQFLLNGVLVPGENLGELPSGFGDFSYNSGLLEQKKEDVVKCNMTNDMEPVLERIQYGGYGGISENKLPVDYNNLETIIPGFTFLQKPCNPCGSIASVPDYSCKYQLNVKGEPNVSNIWKYLWNI